MGACGSNTALPGTPAPPDVHGKRLAAKVISMCSETDMSNLTNAEKKMSASAEAKGLMGTQCCIGFTCRKGRKAEVRAPNQDSWRFYREPNNMSVYAVYDGHGDRGHLVSDYVSNALTESIIFAAKSRARDTTAKVHACYHRVQRNLASRPHLGASMSGTTATVVVHDHVADKLICSHVGDSAAIVLKQDSTSNRLVAECMTRDHRPNLPGERRRIERCGGRVAFDGYAHRVVKKHGTSPGLNMSRSLGDIVAHSACGVSDMPDLLERSVTSQDRALLLCSDGVWEVMSHQECADIIQEYEPWQSMEAAKKLADEASKRWSAGTKGEYVDDITVVLAWLQATATSPSLSRAETCSTEDTAAP